jgi:Undecaprenyl-phosphate glucose phosphotransferase
MTLLGTSDGIVVFLSGYICALGYEATMLPHATVPDIGVNFLVVALRTSTIGGLLAPLVLRQDWGARTIQSVAGVTCRVSVQLFALLGLLLAIGFLTRTWIYVPRTWVLAWAMMIYVTVTGSRLLLLHISGSSLVRGVVRERVAILGERSAANLAASRLSRAYARDIEIIGQFYSSAAPDGREPRRLSDEDVSHVIKFGQRHRLDKVVLAVADCDNDDLDRVVRQLKALSVDIVVYPNTTRLGYRTGNLDLEMIALVSRPIGQSGLVLKAVVDRVLSALLLVWFLPLFAIIAVIIKVDSPGPICFRQRRHGLNNTEFDVIKFRTMTWSGYETAIGIRQTERNDSRLTRVGCFLRRSSLDELPQLLNVLRGEMSLVGPRPHPTMMRTENRLCEEIAADYPHRHRVKPGMTGWAQINGLRGAASTAEQIRRRVEYDLFYIDHWSFLLDLKILLLTPVKMILDNEGAF